jgi:RNA polymerase sigma-70 factor (ECF subfamily)
MGEHPAVDVAQLVMEHHEAVFRYAFRLSGSAADAEDLCQQTFLSAQLHVDQLRGAEAARGWLLAITRNAWLKSHRRRRPAAAGPLELDLDQVASPARDEPEVDEELLKAALDELPDDFRMVLLMFYFEQLSYKEIALKLSIPPGTVMSRLSRAKRQLRARLFESSGVAVHSAEAPPG